MLADTVLFCHTKKSKKAGQDHICLAAPPPRKKREDLKIKHDENNVLTGDELVIARDFLRASKHACLYIRNVHPREFCFK